MRVTQFSWWWPTSVIKSISVNTGCEAESHSWKLPAHHVVSQTSPPSRPIACLPPADLRPDDDGQGEPGDGPD